MNGEQNSFVFGTGEFKKESEQSDYIRWKSYQNDLELNMKINNIKEEKKEEYLLTIAGPYIRELNRLLPDCDDETVTGKYNKLIFRLIKHFKSGYNNIEEILKFREMAQENDETLREFVFRLRRQAAFCEFKDVDREIYIQIVSKCKSIDLKFELLVKETTLEEALEIAQIHEMKSTYFKQEDTAPIKAKPKDREYGACYACGIRGHTRKNANCPARYNSCNKCGRKGHFGKVCRVRKYFSRLP